MDIRRISASETLPIRHQVLWPNLPIEDCILSDDNDGHHFGGFIEKKLICVASVFESENNLRLRKFAVIPKAQGKGCGTQMLQHICSATYNKSVYYLWLDARISTIPFYKRLKFEEIGSRFYKRDELYIKMQRALIFLP